MKGIEYVWCRVLLEKSKPGPLLEVGCRDLTNSQWIASLDCVEDYWGVDIDQVAIKIGRLQVPRLRNRIVQVERDGFGTSLNLQFQNILASCVVYHLDDDLVCDFLRAAQQNLVPGGSVFFNINPIEKGSKWRGLPFLARSFEFYEERASEAGLQLFNLGSLVDFGYDLEHKARSNLILQGVKR